MEEMDHINLHKVSMCPRTLLPNIEALARNVSDRPLVRSRSRRNLVGEKNTNTQVGGSSPKNKYLLPLKLSRYLWKRSRELK